MTLASRRRTGVAILVLFGSIGTVHADGPAPQSSTFGAAGNVSSAQDTPPQSGPRPSLGQTVRSLPGDVVHFVSINTLVITSAGGGAALAAAAWDDEVQAALHPGARESGGFAIGNAYGSAAAQMGGALGVFIAGSWSHHHKLAQTGLDLLRAQAVTGVWVWTVKRVADRDRPDGSSYSFPSGHAALAFASAGVVQRAYGWKPAIPFFGLASYVAAARIASNHHYLSDVVFGAAMGLAGSRSLRMHDSGGHTWLITPVVMPGGGSVWCSRIVTKP